ncbi:MAG: hypothetical protein F6K30_29230, partial [Cyanothece sp. SIO2G6]|nr:hypothetical protein [Cyanothece sp. SIO2G6]
PHSPTPPLPHSPTPPLPHSPTTHLLFVTMHHIVSDGWSMGLFIHELTTLYGAYRRGQPSPLTPLPIQYADYTLWQRQWLRGSVFDNQMHYWQQQLADAPPLLKLPTDHPRPPVQTFEGRTYAMLVSPALSQQVINFTRQQETTLFMVLLATYQILLYHFSGQRDIVVGSPIANRQHTNLEPLIGFFVNTLVLRSQVDDTDTVINFLNKVKQITLDAYAHQDMPFEKIVEVLQPERNPAYLPIFQVWFVLQNTPMPPLELSELTVTPFPTETVTAKFDLLLAIEETDQGLVGRWEYNSTLFEEATIMRLSEYYQLLLKNIVVSPNQLLSQTLPLKFSQSEQSAQASLKKIKRGKRRSVRN